VIGPQVEYAAHARISPGRVSQLAKAGQIVFVDGGKVDFEATDRRRAESRKTGKRPPDGFGGYPDKAPDTIVDPGGSTQAVGGVSIGGITLDEARRRKAIAECMLAEKRALEAAGQLFAFAEFEKVFGPKVDATREALLSVADRMAPELGLDGRGAARLREEILLAMRSLTD
jgi:hypothetical protein